VAQYSEKGEYYWLSKEDFLKDAALSDATWLKVISAGVDAVNSTMVSDERKC